MHKAYVAHNNIDLLLSEGGGGGGGVKILPPTGVVSGRKGRIELSTDISVFFFCIRTAQFEHTVLITDKGVEVLTADYED